MSDILIFKEITTESALVDIEAAASKYDGLYVDMSDKDQRKFVKDQADLINSLLKKVDRARIDIAKGFKLRVESEATTIVERLENANRPFTVLIDEWKAERKAILDAEKDAQEAKELIKQYERDYDDAITANKLYDFERKEAAENERIELERIKSEAADKARIEAELVAKKAIEDANQAKIDAELAAKKAEQDKVDAIARAENERKQAVEDERVKAKLQADKVEKARLADEAAKANEVARLKRIADEKAADIDHRREVNQSVLSWLVLCGADEDTSKKIIIGINKKETEHLSINY